MQSNPPKDEPDADPASIETLIEELDGLVDESTPDTVYEDIQEAKAALVEAHQEGLIDSRHRVLDTRDAAEAFVGSVIFASGLLVEDGVFDIGTHLFTADVAGFPLFLVANTLFVVLMTYALVEWTGRNTRDSMHVLGIPVRVVMILAVSFVVATALMIVWGRIDVVSDPVAALARVNVVWTVGSLGAALGDILSKGDPSEQSVAEIERRAASSRWSPPPESVADALPDHDTESALVADLLSRFDALKTTVDSDELPEVRRIRERAIEAAVDESLDDHIRKYTGRDIAEGFVGSIFFSIPFLVEDGVFDVAAYFLSFRVGGFPVYFVVNAGFVFGMVAMLVYWAGPKEVTVTRPILGFIPRRLVGISLISFLTAAAMMTMWGRVEGWTDPVVAVARISVVWTVASFGAALGDILPGESSGDDIDLSELGEQVEELISDR